MLQGIHQQTTYRMANYSTSEVKRMAPIAPAPERKYVGLESEKKKYTYNVNPYTGPQTASIARRNARERNRVKQVNDSFNALRKRLPTSVIAALSGGARRGSGKKLSKVDTLRMVVEYIRYLQNIVDESDASMGITKTVVAEQMAYEDEGIYSGSSPYSDSVPSPVGSDCSSGVSVYSTNHNYAANGYQMNEQMTVLDDGDLLDTMSWWQHK